MSQPTSKTETDRIELCEICDRRHMVIHECDEPEDGDEAEERLCRAMNLISKRDDEVKRLREALQSAIKDLNWFIDLAGDSIPKSFTNELLLIEHNMTRAVSLKDAKV